MSKSEKRMPMEEAKRLALLISEILGNNGVVHEVCGSIRRGIKKDVGDIDIAVRDIMKTAHVLEQQIGAKVIFPKKSKYSIPPHATTVIHGLTVGLYQANAQQWGAMLLFLTGNGLFNIKMRVYAKAHGFRLNQYGLWRGDDLVAAKKEKQIFKKLGLKYQEPWQREWNDYSSMWRIKING